METRNFLTSGLALGTHEMSESSGKPLALLTGGFDIRMSSEACDRYRKTSVVRFTPQAVRERC